MSYLTSNASMSTKAPFAARCSYPVSGMARGWFPASMLKVRRPRAIGSRWSATGGPQARDEVHVEAVLGNGAVRDQVAQGLRVQDAVRTGLVGNQVAHVPLVQQPAHGRDVRRTANAIRDIV